MWRITDDFWDDWKLLKNMFERCELWQNQVSRGNYPDCDMLLLESWAKALAKNVTHVLQGRAAHNDDTLVSVWFTAYDWCRADKA